jgi:phosphohistidine phosphatase
MTAAGAEKTERKLYLVRHGRYNPEAGPGLTEPGRCECENMAAHLAALDPEIFSVFHSGKRRALETAEIFAHALRLKAAPEMLPGTCPNDDPDPVALILSGMSGAVLVSHLPFLERLVHSLAPAAAERELQFLPCSMAVLAFRGGVWTLEELFHPSSIETKKAPEPKEEKP